MQITIYSVVMTVLWSSLLIVLFSILQRSHRLLDMCSVSGVILLYLFCIIRMFIPIEFRGITVIPSVHIYSTIQKFWNLNVPMENLDGIKVIHLLIAVWIIVSIVLFVHLGAEYLRAGRRIAELSCVKDEEINRVLKEIEQKEKKPLKVEVVKSPGVDTPMGTGMIRKRILIPDRQYTEKELFYILRHEYMHHKNKDLFVQLLVNILCVIYWWNPFVYLLRRDVEHSFEMRCDQAVVCEMNDGEIADYLETLLKVLRLKKEHNENRNHVTGTLGIIRDTDDNIKSRFQTLLRESAPNYKTHGKPVAVMVMVLVLALSYIFIIQPKILPTDEDIGTRDDVYEIEMSESYIIHHEDGTYEFVTQEGDRVVLDESQIPSLVEDGFQVIEE